VVVDAAVDVDVVLVEEVAVTAHMMTAIVRLASGK
jgi:hypothetical protein